MPSVLHARRPRSNSDQTDRHAFTVFYKHRSAASLPAGNRDFSRGMEESESKYSNISIENTKIDKVKENPVTKISSEGNVDESMSNSPKKKKNSYGITNCNHPKTNLHMRSNHMFEAHLLCSPTKPQSMVNYKHNYIFASNGRHENNFPYCYMDEARCKQMPSHKKGLETSDIELDQGEKHQLQMTDTSLASNLSGLNSSPATKAINWTTCGDDINNSPAEFAGSSNASAGSNGKGSAKCSNKLEAEDEVCLPKINTKDVGLDKFNMKVNKKSMFKMVSSRIPLSHRQKFCKKSRKISLSYTNADDKMTKGGKSEREDSKNLPIEYSINANDTHIIQIHSDMTENSSSNNEHDALYRKRLSASVIRDTVISSNTILLPCCFSTTQKQSHSQNIISKYQQLNQSKFRSECLSSDRNVRASNVKGGRPDEISYQSGKDAEVCENQPNVCITKTSKFSTKKISNQMECVSRDINSTDELRGSDVSTNCQRFAFAERNPIIPTNSTTQTMKDNLLLKAATLPSHMDPPINVENKMTTHKMQRFLSKILTKKDVKRNNVTSFNCNIHGLKIKHKGNLQNLYDRRLMTSDLSRIRKNLLSTKPVNISHKLPDDVTIQSSSGGRIPRHAFEPNRSRNSNLPRSEPTKVITILPRPFDQEQLQSVRTQKIASVPRLTPPITQQTMMPADNRALPFIRKRNELIRPLLTTILQKQGPIRKRLSVSTCYNITPQQSQNRKLPFLPQSKHVTKHTTTTASHIVKSRPALKQKQDPVTCDPSNVQSDAVSSLPNTDQHISEKELKTVSATGVHLQSLTNKDVQPCNIKLISKTSDKTSSPKVTTLYNNMKKSVDQVLVENLQTNGKQIYYSCSVESGEATDVISQPQSGRNTELNEMSILGEAGSSVQNVADCKGPPQARLAEYQSQLREMPYTATLGTASTRERARYPSSTLNSSIERPPSTRTDANEDGRLFHSQHSLVCESGCEKSQLNNGKCTANTPSNLSMAGNLNETVNIFRLNSSKSTIQGTVSNLSEIGRNKSMGMCRISTSNGADYTEQCPVVGESAIMSRELGWPPKQKPFENDNFNVRSRARVHFKPTITQRQNRSCSADLPRQKQFSTLFERHGRRLTCGPTHITATPSIESERELVNSVEVSSDRTNLLATMNNDSASDESISDARMSERPAFSHFESNKTTVSDFLVTYLGDVEVSNEGRVNICNAEQTSPIKDMIARKTNNSELADDFELLADSTLQLLIKHMQNKKSANLFQPHINVGPSFLASSSEQGRIIEAKSTIGVHKVRICEESHSKCSETASNEESPNKNQSKTDKKKSNNLNKVTRTISNSCLPTNTENSRPTVLHTNKNFAQSSSTSSYSMILASNSSDNVFNSNEKLHSLRDLEANASSQSSCKGNAEELKSLLSDIVEQSISACLLAVSRSMHCQNKKLSKRRENMSFCCPTSVPSVVGEHLCEKKLKEKNSNQRKKINTSYRQKDFPTKPSRILSMSTETEGYVAEKDNSESEKISIRRPRKMVGKKFLQQHKPEDKNILENSFEIKNKQCGQEIVHFFQNKKRHTSDVNDSLHPEKTSNKYTDLNAKSEAKKHREKNLHRKIPPNSKRNRHFTIFLSASKSNSSNFLKSEIPYISSDHVRQLVKKHIYAIPQDLPVTKETKAMCAKRDPKSVVRSSSEGFITQRRKYPCIHNSFISHKLRPKAKTTNPYISITHRNGSVQNGDRKLRRKKKQKHLCLFGWTSESVFTNVEKPIRCSYLKNSPPNIRLKRDTKRNGNLTGHQDQNECKEKATKVEKCNINGPVTINEGHNYVLAVTGSASRAMPHRSRAKPSTRALLRPPAPPRATGEGCAGGGRKETLWAITQINTFHDGSSTYEVLEPTRRRPKHIPERAHNIFVVTPSNNVLRP